MAKISDYLSQTGRNSAQQNISVRRDMTQAYSDALEALLKAAPLRTSVSAIVVDAVIQQAAVVRAKNERGG